MIDVYPTRVEACGADGKVLFVLEMVDEFCCTLQVKNPLVLANGNLEQVLTAVRSGMHMLGLED
jgi:hypothetical protein